MNSNNNETNTSLTEVRDWSEEIKQTRQFTYGNYDDQEIIDALELQEKIIRGVRKMNRICFQVIEDLYVFIEGGHYKTLGHSNFKNWITSCGGAPSTFYRYLAMYRLFTVEHKIPISEYEYVDITKLNTMMVIAKYANNVDEIKKLIIDADEMIISDCRWMVREELRKKQGIGVDASVADETYYDHIEGSYKLVKLTNEEKNSIDIKSMKILKKSLIKNATMYCANGELQYLIVEG